MLSLMGGTESLSGVLELLLLLRPFFCSPPPGSWRAGCISRTGKGADGDRHASGCPLHLGQSCSRECFLEPRPGPSPASAHAERPSTNSSRLRLLEVPKGLLDTGIEECVIEVCRFFEIGHDDIDVSQRIKGEHTGVEIRVLNYRYLGPFCFSVLETAQR
jgi:hypothetical protein